MTKLEDYIRDFLTPIILLPIIPKASPSHLMLHPSSSIKLQVWSLEPHPSPFKYYSSDIDPHPRPSHQRRHPHRRCPRRRSSTSIPNRAPGSLPAPAPDARRRGRGAPLHDHFAGGVGVERSGGVDPGLCGPVAAGMGEGGGGEEGGEDEKEEGEGEKGGVHCYFWGFGFGVLIFGLWSWVFLVGGGRLGGRLVGGVVSGCCDVVVTDWMEEEVLSATILLLIKESVGVVSVGWRKVQ